MMFYHILYGDINSKYYNEDILTGMNMQENFIPELKQIKNLRIIT